MNVGRAPNAVQTFTHGGRRYWGMRPSVLFAAALMSTALAGCLEESAHDMAPGVQDHAPQWFVMGAFTAEATQNDFDEIAREVDALGGDVLFMESFPVQYQVRKLTETTCAQAQQLLASKEYVATVGECRQETTSANPDEPVSDGPARATWSVHGSFTENATNDEIRALEEEMLALGATDMPVLLSYPAQYIAQGFPTAEACESAREVLAQKTFVASVRECQASPADDDDPTATDSENAAG